MRRRRGTPKQNAAVLLVFVSFALLLYHPLLVLIPIIGVIGYAILWRIKSQEKREALLWTGNIDEMNGGEFENMIFGLFEVLGYHARHTGKTGDFGTDIILKKDDITIAVQAKRYAKNVGNAAVQQALSGKYHYKADEGWVVTNAYFTKAAKKQAETSGVKLVDRDKLLELIIKARNKSEGATIHRIGIDSEIDVYTKKIKNKTKKRKKSKIKHATVNYKRNGGPPNDIK